MVGKTRLRPATKDSPTKTVSPKARTSVSDKGLVASGISSSAVKLQALAGNRAVQRLVQQAAEEEKQSSDLFNVPGVNLPAPGGGRPLPEDLRGDMEQSFGESFDDVRVHEGAAPKSVGAVAYTQGLDIHFAPGKYRPDSSSGRALVGHELTHVVQQRAGVVSSPQGAGAPVNASPQLEEEAAHVGDMAAGGANVAVRGAGSGVQRLRDGLTLVRPTEPAEEEEQHVQAAPAGPQGVVPSVEELEAALAQIRSEEGDGLDSQSEDEVDPGDAQSILATLEKGQVEEIVEQMTPEDLREGGVLVPEISELEEDGLIDEDGASEDLASEPQSESEDEPPTLAARAGQAAGAAGKKVQEGAKYVGGKVATGAKYAGGKAAEGAKYAGGKAAEGAKYAGKKTAAGAKYAGGKAAEGARYAGKKTAEGAKYAGKKTAAGAKYVGGKAAEGAKYAGKKTAAGAKYAGGKAAEGARYAGKKTAEGAKYAGTKTVEGAKYVGGKVAEGARAAGSVAATEAREFPEARRQGEAEISEGLAFGGGVANAAKGLVNTPDAIESLAEGSLSSDSPGLQVPETAAQEVMSGFSVVGHGFEAAANLAEVGAGISQVRDPSEIDGIKEGSARIGKGLSGATKGGLRSAASGVLLDGGTAATATGLATVAAGAQIAEGAVETVHGALGARKAERRRKALSSIADEAGQDAEVADSARYGAKVQKKKRNRRAIQAGTGALKLTGGALLLALGVSNPIGWALTGAAGAITAGLAFRRWKRNRQKDESGKKLKQLKREERQRYAQLWASDTKKYEKVLLAFGYEKDQLAGLSEKAIYKALLNKNWG